MILTLKSTARETKLLADWWYSGLLGRDATGNKNDITRYNEGTTSMATPGIGFTGTRFGVNSEYGRILTPSAEMNALQLPITYVWWSKFDTGATEAGSVLDQYSSTTSHKLIRILGHATKFEYYYSKADGTYQFHSYSVNPTKDVWHFFAVVVNGTLASPTVQMYCDGRLETFSGAAMSTTPDLTVPWTVASSYSSGAGSEKRPGYIGPMRVYGRALPAMEIAALRHRSVHFKQPSRIRLYTGFNGVISGYTYSSGAPVARRVVLMTEPPTSRVVAEFTTSASDGLFSFTNLAPGNYLVLDCMTDNTRQALVYDWIVVS